MQISATSNTGFQSLSRMESLDKLKRLFLELGEALASGDVAAAKEAYTQLLKNTPAAATNTANPIAEKVAALGKALATGSLEGAKAAYNEIKAKLAQRLSGGGRPHGTGGPPPDNGGQTARTSARKADMAPDLKARNEHESVSRKEEFETALKHREPVDAESDPGKLDTLV